MSRNCSDPLASLDHSVAGLLAVMTSDSPSGPAGWWAAIRKAPLEPLSDLCLMYNQIEDE
jgi:hypothetical protein